MENGNTGLCASPSVSVIVPAYNAASTIERCIESVIKQPSLKELIVVNDGSHDETGLIAAGFAERYKEIILLEQENAGRSVARNNGLDQATGKWIAFLDSDDYLPQDSLDTLISVASDSEVVWGGIKTPQGGYGLTGSCGMLQSRDVLTSLVDPKSFRKKYRNTCNMDGIVPRSVCGGLYLRSMLDEGGVRFIENLKFGEDGLFNIAALSNSEHVSFVNKATYFYDLNSSSTCRAFSIEDIDYLIHYSKAVETTCCPLIREGFMTRADRDALIAQETISTISRIARFCNVADVAEMAVKRILSERILVESLNGFRPNTTRRSLLWLFERHLLNDFGVRAVLFLEAMK